MAAVLAALLISGVTLAPVSAQPVPDDVRTILVTGTGAATAPAETARIQFLVANYGDIGMGVDPAMPAMPAAEPPVTESVEIAEGEVPDGSPEVSVSESGVTVSVPAMGTFTLTDEDVQPIVDAVVEGGAPEDAVSVNTGPSVSGYYGPGAPAYGLVEVQLTDPNLEQVNAIVDAANAAATEAMLPMQQIGVEYNVADCGPILDAARAAAFDDARARAEALAQHFGATVGGPVQVSDYGSTLQPLSGTGCPPSPEVAVGMFGPAPVFNTPAYSAVAPAEARVLIQLSVAYEFELASQ